MLESRALARSVLFAMLLVADGAATHAAGPTIPAGDFALRQDIQLLADAGIVRGPVTSWPLAWGPILADLDRAGAGAAANAAVAGALLRVRQRAESETRVGALQFRAGASAAEDPVPVRGFADTPRESAEATAGISWLGDRLSIELNGQAVTSPDDGEEFRADGSQVGVALGNYAIAASTLDRWWGPGWDGSLILSNNARPIPALTLDRIFTEPFRTRWLSWIGPWDLSVIAGRMESDREVPDTQFFGLRFNFRPLPSLEIGVSRTAQWCGEGRPCDFGTFGDLLLGRDNRGDAGIDTDNEPGNQLAGLDARWSFAGWGLPLAVYGQLIGEDEAGGFPSRYLALGGIEASGLLGAASPGGWGWQAFLELAGTSCDFLKDDIFNCAYNHAIYRSGYRYRGRPVGHGADNDARIVSAGFFLVNDADTQWRLLARYGELNRAGAPDAHNSLTPTPQDLASVDLAYGRPFRYGVIEVGAGVERIDDAVSGESDNDTRAFLQWRSSP